MYELWALEADGWRRVYSSPDLWRVMDEARRWPVKQTEIIDTREAYRTSQ